MSIRLIESGKSIQIVRQIIVERAMKTNLVDNNVQRYLIATKMEREKIGSFIQSNADKPLHSVAIVVLQIQHSDKMFIWFEWCHVIERRASVCCRLFCILITIQTGNGYFKQQAPNIDWLCLSCIIDLFVALDLRALSIKLTNDIKTISNNHMCKDTVTYSAYLCVCACKFAIRSTLSIIISGFLASS